MLDKNVLHHLDSVNSRLAALAAEVDVKKRLPLVIELANSLVSLITSEATYSAQTVIDDRLVPLPNAERQDHWFKKHPWMGDERSAFDVFDGAESPIQAKLYWMNKRSRQYVAGGVHLTENWEDRDFTRNPQYKIGIDFFVNSALDSVLVVLSNRGNLRLVELSGKLTNTQIEVFTKWLDVRGETSQERLHGALWDSFKLQSVNSRFYDGVSNAFNELLVHLRQSGRDEEDSKLFASRLMGRLIFVWFLRKMTLISEDMGYFDADAEVQGDYYRQRLERLFFRTLNKPIGDRSLELDGQLDLHTPYLNGGLFSPRADDWYGDESLSFPSGYFPRVFEHFNDFNFTTDESTPEYEQVAIDPEMLGRVFESLLASQIALTGEQARKAKGAFYTPREIVSYMCKEAVRGHLESLREGDARVADAVSKLLDTSDQDWAIAGTNSLRDIPSDLKVLFLESLRDLKTLDPACGSGAFPLGLLQLLSKLQLRLDPETDHYQLKLSILQNNIFGSDIEPMAVEISRLRSWLSLIVEEQNAKSVEPLPNLEFNFVCANSLIALHQEHLFTDHTLQGKLQALRIEYFSANDPKKKSEIQSNYLSLTSPALFDDVDERAGQLKSFNPFDSHKIANFFDAETMFGIHEGFDVVVGNPPYIGLKGHSELFDTVKNSDLGKRFFSGKMDYFYFFFHLGLDNLKVGGTLAFITTNYFVTATYAKKLIEDIRTRASVREFINFNEMKIFESAAGQHNMITVLQRGVDENLPAKTTVVSLQVSGKADSTQVIAVLEKKEPNAEYLVVKQSDLFDGDKILLSKNGENDIDVVLDAMAGTNLRVQDIAKVRQGIISGADKVTRGHVEKLGAESGLVGKGIFVLSADEVASLNLSQSEQAYVKPHFKNSDIFRYGAKNEATEFIIFADRRTMELENLPVLSDHLGQFSSFLQGGDSTFPYLHRPRAISYEAEKIIVSKRAPDNRFGYSDGIWYGSSDINFIESSNPLISTKALLGLLNSSFYYAWFYHRGKRKGKLLELFQVPIAEAPAPVLNPENIKRLAILEGLVSEVIALSKDGPSKATEMLEVRIDELVGTIFGFTEEQTDLVSSWARLEKESLGDIEYDTIDDE